MARTTRALLVLACVLGAVAVGAVVSSAFMPTAAQAGPRDP
jgi:hypothetical protein